MANTDDKPLLTDSLEDYLETVYELVRDKKFARVKDIARARDVRPGSVSPAMKRLAEMGLIEYVRREYICLTPEGEERARRVVARHQLLCRLFEGILKMESGAAEAEACAMEHSLSDEAMDRLVRFFEFLQICPDAKNVLTKFRECQAIDDERGFCKDLCTPRIKNVPRDDAAIVRLPELELGENATVSQISGHGSTRQHLLDMGFMPNVELGIARVDHRSGALWICLGGFEVSLTSDEAKAVMVRRRDV